ncbi:unnamed protein product, partial [Choristocarpus tenellus]
VEFVVTVYPCVVGISNYLEVVQCLNEKSQAFVYKRVGWLALWNPSKPDGYVELALDRREERQVAKVRNKLNELKS